MVYTENGRYSLWSWPLRQIVVAQSLTCSEAMNFMKFVIPLHFISYGVLTENGRCSLSFRYILFHERTDFVLLRRSVFDYQIWSYLAKFTKGVHS